MTIWVIAGTILIGVAIGLIAKFVVIPALGGGRHLSGREFVVGVVLLTLMSPLSMVVAKNLSVAQTLRYEEFYNGVEVEAKMVDIECLPGRRGNSASSGKSNCHHQYNTGQRYSYMETVPKTETYMDANGDMQTRTYYVEETRWASIYHPYSHSEQTYMIKDSIGGEHKFSDVYIPEDAEPYADKTIPNSIPRGAPKEWVESRARLDAGDPRPVTGVFTYDNYILASKDEMTVPFSMDVERYSEAGLLPDHTANILTEPLTGFNGAFAHKMSFVGVEVTNEEVWQESVMGFNAALGSKLRGDLHVVAIDAALVDDPTSYVSALRAYWSGDHFERRAIAKNAVVVVLGVEGDTVQWAKATTGMPYGNELMAQGVQDFTHSIPFTPEAVIGDPKTVIIPATEEDAEDEVRVTLADEPGALESVILRDFPFQRACMSCNDEGEGVGYSHMITMIPPKTSYLVIMGLGVVVLSTLFWWFVGSTHIIDNIWDRYISRKQSKSDDDHDDHYDLYDRRHHDYDDYYEDLYDRRHRRY